MNLFFKYSITFLIFLQTFIVKSQIPLPEHPRPDFQRQMWENLNGQWDFKFDQNNIGEKEKWQNQTVKFDKKIIVPFPWGSRLSGVQDEANIAWYNRKINVSKDWKGKKTFITKNTLVHIMPKNRSLDIDTKEDFLLAKKIIKVKK